jgi:hypothetical protein
MKTKSVCLLAAVAACAMASLPVTADSTFDVSGTMTVLPSDGGGITTLGGTITLNTTTGVVDAVDVTFTKPSPDISGSVPALTNVGFETATGGPGTHVYDIEACASTVCSTNWLVNLVVVTANSGGSLVGYTGGRIQADGLFYGGVQDTWAGCPSGDVTVPCGALKSTTTITPPPPPGVPEPASGALLLVGLAALRGLRRRTRV